MSAFGGKADVRELPAVCLLIAKSGHSEGSVERHDCAGSAETYDG